MSHRKKLISNFLSLSGVRIAGYALPLITLPYLARVLGVEKFGLVALAQAVAQYFCILTDYGFNLSATREVSISRDDQAQLSRIFSAVISTKVSLLAMSFLILSLSVLIIDKFRAEWLLYLLSFGIVGGQAIFPIWFFQGMEKMKLAAILDVAAKAFFTITIFVFVRKEANYIYVPLLSSLGFIVSGIISLAIAIYWFKVKIRIAPFSDIVYQLKEGWYVFVSSVAVITYTVGGIVILGLFTNDTIVGYYSGGERIIRGVQVGLLYSVSQTVYPHISKLASESKEAALIFAKRMMKVISLPTLAASVVLFLSAPYIGGILLGQQFKNSILVIRILALVPFVAATSNVFTVQLMLNMGLKRDFMRILTFAALGSTLLSLLLVVPLQHIGVAISVLVTETAVMVMAFVSLKHNGIDVFNARIYRKPNG
jgi:polysaccharide transporter, PST family